MTPPPGAKQQLRRDEPRREPAIPDSSDQNRSRSPWDRRSRSKEGRGGENQDDDQDWAAWPNHGKAHRSRENQERSSWYEEEDNNDIFRRDKSDCNDSYDNTGDNNRRRNDDIANHTSSNNNNNSYGNKVDDTEDANPRLYVWEDITPEDREGRGNNSQTPKMPKNTTGSAELVAAAIARRLGGKASLSPSLQNEKGLEEIDSAPFSSRELLGSVVMRPCGRIPNTIPPHHVRSLSLHELHGEGAPERCIRSKEVMAFFLVARPLGSNEEWQAPTLQVFNDFMGFVEVAVLVEWQENANIIEWTNEWGQVGIMGLNSLDEDLLGGFRGKITRKKMQGMEFNTFPKEAMTRTPDLTCVIKNNLRTFDANRLPRALFVRNPELQGTLQVTHVKMYGAQDTTRNGQTKRGWRLVVLKGDQEVLNCLSQYSDKHVFVFGSHGIQIRGGKRLLPTEGSEELDHPSHRGRGRRQPTSRGLDRERERRVQQTRRQEWRQEEVRTNLQGSRRRRDSGSTDNDRRGEKPERNKRRRNKETRRETKRKRKRKRERELDHSPQPGQGTEATPPRRPTSA